MTDRIEDRANAQYRKAVDDANRMNDKGEIPAPPKPAPDAMREALLKRTVEFIQANDPFGDAFSEHDLKLFRGESLMTDKADTASEPCSICGVLVSQMPGEGHHWGQCAIPVPPPDGAAKTWPTSDRGTRSNPSADVDPNLFFAPPPPSDDVRSALADDLDLIGAALSKYRHPSAVTHAFYRVSAALRSAPVSAAAIARLQEIVDLDSHGRYGRLAREAIDLLGAPAVGVTREAIARTNLIRDSVQSVYDELCVQFSGVHSDDATDSILLRLHASLKLLDSPAPDATVSDERALDLAERLCARTRVMSVEDAACEIMQYATDAAHQLHREGYFSSPQHVGIEAAVTESINSACDLVRDAVIAEIWQHFDKLQDDHQMPVEDIKAAIRSLTGAKP